MDGYLGEIRLVAFNFVPRNWLLCDGSLLPVKSNVALFSLLGTTYGGDGVNTFALPTFPPKPTPGITEYFVICISGIYPTK
jgi:microcystin-dependent protein